MASLEEFRQETRQWLADHCPESIRGQGISYAGGSKEVIDNADFNTWFGHCVKRGYTVPSWPTTYGGAGLSVEEAKILTEEMRSIKAPLPLVGMGTAMIGPTLLELGDDDQKARHLPKIASGEIRWCQGYSEPDSGSDLASLQTRAVRAGDDFLVNGQKVWTSGAETAHWCFALCRTEPAAKPKHRGISYLLIPMDQPGVEVRPIVQMTGDSEFSEVFYDGARTAADNVVGEISAGWRVSQATLAFERGASTLGQQLDFQNELDEIIAVGRANGRIHDPLIRQRIADAWIGLRIQRYNALRTLSGEPGSEAARAGMITKLHWATWHRDLGKLAMDVLGPESEIIDGAGDELSSLQRMYLFSRADTVYGGTNEIQRNIIAERALGLPRDPKPVETSR